MATSLRRMSMKISKLNRDAIREQNLVISEPTEIMKSTTVAQSNRLSQLQPEQISLMNHSSLAIYIGSLVKDGQLGQEEAMSKFSELSQSLPPQMMTRKQDDKADISYSIKNNKDNITYTMKFDLKNKTINLYWKGKCKYRYSFDDDIKSYESEDGNSFTITLSSLETLEFEAEELEEKNAIIDVLGRFKDLNEKLKVDNFETPGKSNQPTSSNEAILEDQKLDNLDPSDIGHTRGSHYLQLPSNFDVTASLRIPVIKPLIKSGDLEKKGHGKGALTYAVRYVEIKTGQLAYFRPSDKIQPLNILTLDHNTIVESDADEFKIKQRSAKNEKNYHFRVPKSYRGTIEDWVRAIDFARTGNDDIRFKAFDNNTQSVKNSIPIRESSPKKKNTLKKNSTVEVVLHVPIDGPPMLNLDDNNLGRLICEFKNQISFLQLMTNESKACKINDVTLNLIKICNFMEDQIRQNPNDEVYFEPIKILSSATERLGRNSTSSFQSPDKQSDKIEDSYKKEPVPRKISSNIQHLGDILEQSLSDRSPVKQIQPSVRSPISSNFDEVIDDSDEAVVPGSDEQLQKEIMESTLKDGITMYQDQDAIEVFNDVITEEKSIGLNFSVVHSVCMLDSLPLEVPVPEEVLKKIPPPPPSLPELVEYFLNIGKVSTHNSQIPCCPPNMPEAIKMIKKELGIADIPDPPPNLPEVGGLELAGNIASDVNFPLAATVRKSNCKMRLVAWDKIPNGQIRFDSVWLKTTQVAPEINFEFLESCFKNKKSDVIKNIKPTKPKLETILDDKRGMGISIFLKNFGVNRLASEDTNENYEKFKVTGEKSKIDYIDEKLNLVEESNGGYSQDILEELAKYPTDEDIDLFKNTKIKPENMVEFDRFVYTICNINFYKERIEILTKIRDIPIEYMQTLPLIQKLQLACDVLKDNAELDRVLMVVLTIGNYINGGNARGNASGFKLSYLPKLVDYRGNDIKFSLLHFLAKHIVTQEMDLIYFYEKLQPVNSAIDASVEGILAEVELIEKRLKKIKSTAKKIGESNLSKFAEFLEGVDNFCKQYEDKINELRLQYSSLRDAYTNLLNKYGESDQLESDEFFGYISYFIRDFKRVSNELLKKMEQEKKNKENEERKLLAENDKKLNKPSRQYQRTFTMNKLTKQSKKESLAHSHEELLQEDKAMTLNRFTSQQENNFDINPENLLGRANTYKNISGAARPKLIKLNIGEVQSEIKGKWKKREFQLNGKELITINKKGKLEDKIVLSSKTEAKINSKDDTILEINSDKNLSKLKLNSSEDAQILLDKVRHNSNS